jgi:hypothetical protein
MGVSSQLGDKLLKHFETNFVIGLRRMEKSGNKTASDRNIGFYPSQLSWFIVTLSRLDWNGVWFCVKPCPLERAGAPVVSAHPLTHHMNLQIWGSRYSPDSTAFTDIQ